MSDTFNLDELANLDPFAPIENFDEGIYHIECGAGELYKEGKSYKHVLTILDGAKKGGSFWVFQNKDLTKVEAKRGLLTTLLSCGIKKDQMKGKSYNFETTLKGKKAYVHYTPPIDYKSTDPKEKYPVIRFILPENVEAMKDRYAAGAHATSN